MSNRTGALPPLPYSAEAERNVLGAIILADGVPNPVLKRVVEALHSGDFFLEQHRLIFSRMLELDGNGQPIELLTLVEHLQATAALEAAGGPPYISQLFDGMPKVSIAVHYARIVHEKSVRRILAHSGQKLVDSVFAPSVRLEEISQQILELTKVAAPLQQKGGLAAVTADTFLRMELPLREAILEPILATQSLSLLYA